MATKRLTTPAACIYQIYSHTGYVDAKDSDFDSARDDVSSGLLEHNTSSFVSAF
jgi:hypothetical protein